MEQGNYPMYIANDVINVQKIVTIHYFNLITNIKTPKERHNFWEIIYADEGEVLIKTDNDSFKLRCGEACFHYPDEEHSFVVGNTPSSVFVLSFVCFGDQMKVLRHKKISVSKERGKHRKFPG